ncbi:MAG: hypothetical protein M3188_01270 [Actinomycetota bacterium]|nr:hypothetical protein [Actinomycetota bacterium]
MRIHQPGSHLTDRRGAQVDDWSWSRTMRRVGVLAQLAVDPERPEVVARLAEKGGAGVVVEVLQALRAEREQPQRALRDRLVGPAQLLLDR